MTQPDDIERRAAERERELLERLDDQRRMARIEDFVYDTQQEAFWDIQDNTLHSEKSVDAKIPRSEWTVIVEEGDPEPQPDAPRRRGRPRRRRETLVRPSQEIMRVENDQLVEGSTWWPGKPKIIKDWFIDKDGFYPAKGRRSFNQYRPPPEPRGDASKAGPWVEHVKLLWSEEKEHNFFFDYCAHMVQRPHEKCNAAIVLSGTQGIGKDAALVAVKAAVGDWNHKGIEPDALFSPYQPWLQTLMLTIDEVRPSRDEYHASTMYNILKPLIAAPPNTLPLNDKYQRLRYVVNVLRVFITTNDWMDMYIPPEDRRMFVMHSSLPSKWHLDPDSPRHDPQYFDRYFRWLEHEGGFGHVARWLFERDISRFDPKRQVERTAGWEAVAGSWGAPDDAVTHALEKLGRPAVFFGQELVDHAFDDQDEIVAMLKSPRKIAHRMRKEGYMLRRSPDGERWVFREGGKVFRSRLAFVREEMMRDAVACDAAVQRRGRELVAAQKEPA
jgi:hypothetical protein